MLSLAKSLDYIFRFLSVKIVFVHIHKYLTLANHMLQSNVYVYMFVFSFSYVISCESLFFLLIHLINCYQSGRLINHVKIIKFN